MPTNLKTLLSRSRSRNELKLREKEEESCCEQSSNEGESGGSKVLPTSGSGSSSKSFVGCQCPCSCHRVSGGASSPNGEPVVRAMRRDSSCKSLFFSCGTLNGVGDVGMESSGNAFGSSSAATPVTGTHTESSSCQSLSMRKCETVLALSTLNGNLGKQEPAAAAAAAAPHSPSYSFRHAAYSSVDNGGGGGGGASTSQSNSSNSTANTNATKVSRVMKEKIFSTSSSTLNCLLHSSNRSKLFSGWKLSSSSNTTSSNNHDGSSSAASGNTNSKSGAGTNGGGVGSSSGVGGGGGSASASDKPSDVPRASGNSQSINCVNSSSAPIATCQKSRSQLSISTNDGANGVGLSGGGGVSPGDPLTPMNRLRRNTSVNNTNTFCPNSSLTNSAYSRSSSVTSFNWNTEDQLQEILCRLCLSNVRVDDTVEILACACRYCKDCVMAYVSFEIQEGAYDIACPDAICEKQGVLTVVEIENLVSTTLMEKYRKFRLYREVEKDGQLMWCPSPGCETACRIQEVTTSMSRGSENKVRGGSRNRNLPNINCTTCHKSYCAECKLSWHPDTSCEAFRRKLIKQGKLSLDEDDLFSLESIKKCPFCHVPIEKDSGCAQMMCKRCKHVFCWYCLVSLDDDFLLRHYDKGPCKNKLGHSRASVVWHRAQVIGIFAGFGVLVLLASPLLILAAPCLLCCRCRYCANKLDPDESPVPV